MCTAGSDDRRGSQRDPGTARGPSCPQRRPPAALESDRHPGRDRGRGTGPGLTSHGRTAVVEDVAAARRHRCRRGCSACGSTAAPAHPLERQEVRLPRGRTNSRPPSPPPRPRRRPVGERPPPPGLPEPGSTTTTSATDSTSTTTAATVGPPTILVPATQQTGNWTSPAFTIAGGQWDIGWAFQCSPTPTSAPGLQIFAVNAGANPAGTPAVTSSAASGQSVTTLSSTGSRADRGPVAARLSLGRQGDRFEQLRLMMLQVRSLRRCRRSR